MPFVTPACFCVLATLAAQPVIAEPSPPVASATEATTQAPVAAESEAVGRVPGQPTAQDSADATQTQHRTTLSTVLVRGVRLDDIRRAQAQVPGSVYVTSGETFHQRPVNNIADALRYVPGAFVESDSGGASSILSIRGSNLNSLGYDNAGVTLFQDGLPVTTADGANHNRLMDPLQAHEAIVANGINALTYGASNLGGAIDFISPTARNSNPNQLYLEGGSYGLHEEQLRAGGVVGDLDGMVTFDDKYFDGYLPHSREERNSLYANGGWQVTDNFRLRSFLTYINDRQQLTGSITQAQFDANPMQADPAYVFGDHQVNVKTYRFATEGTWDINASSQLQFGVSYEQQRLFHPIVDMLVDIGPDQPPLDVYSLLINTTQRTSGATVRYNVVDGNHDVLVGMNLVHTVNAGGNYNNLQGQRGAQQAIVDTRGSNANVFALDRWQFVPGWTLVYGVQGVMTDLDDRTVDDVNVGNTVPRNRKNHFSSLNPRLGLIRALGTDAEAFASIGRLYQSPNFFDLDNARQERGPQADLDSMQGLSYEVGVRGREQTGAGAPSWHWSASVYYEQVHDEILSIHNPAPPPDSLTTNIAHTVHAGVEALVGASLPIGTDGSRVEPLLSAAFNDFSFGDDPVYGNNHLPSAPRYLVRGEVMYRNAKGFYAGPTFDLVGWRDVDFANAYRVGGYGLMGLRAGVQHGRWDFFGELDNAFDRKYVREVSVMNAATPLDAVLTAGAPRSVFVGLRLEY